MKITTEWLTENKACKSGVRWLEANTGIGADAPDVLRDLRTKQEWSYYRWLAPRLMTHAQRVEWAVFCAEQVLGIFEKKYPNDKLPRLAIEAAKKWISDPSEENKTAAAYAADAADAAYAAYAADAADYAAAAAYAAADAAAAAYAAAAYAAADAAADAAAAAYAAAAYAAAYAAAAAREEMRIKCAEKAEEIISYQTP